MQRFPFPPNGLCKPKLSMNKIQRLYDNLSPYVFVDTRTGLIKRSIISAEVKYLNVEKIGRAHV